MTEKACFKPEMVYFKPEMVHFKPEKAHFKTVMARFMPDRVRFQSVGVVIIPSKSPFQAWENAYQAWEGPAPKKVYLISQRVRLLPERVRFYPERAHFKSEMFIMTEKTRFKPGPFQARAQKMHVPSLKKHLRLRKARCHAWKGPSETREPGGGGSGGNLPPQLGSCGGSPPTLDCQCRSFIFLFVFARELGPLPKNSGPNPGSF